MTARTGVDQERTLDHLPELYREAVKRSPLLGGLLSASDTLLLGFEQQLDVFAQYLDPRNAPADAPGADTRAQVGSAQVSFLTYLTSWLDFERQLHWTASFLRELGLDPEVIEARRRLVAAEAGAMARRKGTRAGLERLLWGCLGIRVEVHERTWSERMVIGESPMETRLLDRYDASRMAEVVWRVSAPPSDALKAGVRCLIDREVPAHITVLLRVVVERRAEPVEAKR